ncbi:SUKH-4 family immunity protein [Actinoplanes xinjiangensis]|uniref:SUKH-4 family immunity protein n=1 Tax=Actinoplanes xinjiangensis TaxID=512350 RepID=UPI003418723D
MRLVDGAVWMLFGYDDVPRRTARINTSVTALQAILTLWDEFVGSGVHEDDDGYEELVEEVLRRAREPDPQMFEDEESWWSRVFEEVELGVLAPE